MPVREPPAGTSVILGGTRGIGGAVALRLASPGTHLVLLHLERTAEAEAHARRLTERGATVRLIRGNIAAPETLGAVAAAVEEAGQPCRHLVHSVAVTTFKPLIEVRPNQWDLVFAVSTRSLLTAVQALRRPLAAAHGRVVAISSQGATRHIPAYGPLGPAKAALEGLVRQLAVELAPEGIVLNAVRAGLVESDAASRLPDIARGAVRARTPLGRIGSLEDVAGAVCLLLSPDAGWIVGQVLEVDGGFSST